MSAKDGIQKIIDNTRSNYFNNKQKMIEGASYLWEIKGEDPNCDMGGTHGNPSLGFVTGTLRDVAAYAYGKKNMCTWGSYGYLRLIDTSFEVESGYYEKVISGEIEKEREILSKRKHDLEKELQEINEKLN